MRCDQRVPSDLVKYKQPHPTPFEETFVSVLTEMGITIKHPRKLFKAFAESKNLTVE